MKTTFKFANDKPISKRQSPIETLESNFIEKDSTRDDFARGKYYSYMPDLDMYFINLAIRNSKEEIINDVEIKAKSFNELKEKVANKIADLMHQSYYKERPIFISYTDMFKDEDSFNEDRLRIYIGETQKKLPVKRVVGRTGGSLFKDTIFRNVKMNVNITEERVARNFVELSLREVE